MSKDDPVPVLAYTYFWLHTNLEHGGHDIEKFWGRPSLSNGTPHESVFNDGDHFFGKIVEECVITESYVTVTTAPLFRLVSTDGARWQFDDPTPKWRAVHTTAHCKQTLPCKQVSKPGLRRARFRNKQGEIIILSNDPLDEELFKFLTQS